MRSVYDQAREHFEQSLELDADNEIAKQAIAQIDEMLRPKPPFRLSWAEETQAEETSSGGHSITGWIRKERQEYADRVAEQRRLAAEETEKRALKNRAEKQVSGFEFQAKGHNGQIELYRNKVCIRRKGVLAFLTQGLKGDKEIMISSISSIQFKKASAWTNGYIQFSFIGGQEAKGGILQATEDENTVMFTTEQQLAFERIKAEVEKRIQAESVPSVPPSDADEIAKLAGLRDKGILTEDEFQQKKKQILGL